MILMLYTAEKQWTMPEIWMPKYHKKVIMSKTIAVCSYLGSIHVYKIVQQ
jgi:hypothetical protein